MVHTEYADSMKPKFSFPAGRIGSPTSPMTPKQLQEFGSRLNEGVKNVEVGTLDPTNFETIPTEHFEEIRRLAQITGSNASLHAPMLDLSGFQGGEQGSHWSEEGRLQMQQQLVSIMERANLMADKDKGSIPIVIHAGNTFAQEYDKRLNERVPVYVIDPNTGDKKIDPSTRQYEIAKDEKGNDLFRPGIRKMAVVNPESGRISVVEFDEKYDPLSGEKQDYDPWTRIGSMNKTEWDEERLKVFEKIKLKDELMQKQIQKEVQNRDIEQAGLNTEDSPNYHNDYIRNMRDIQSLKNHIKEIDTKMSSEIHELHNKILTNKPPEKDPTFKAYNKALEDYERFLKEARQVHERDSAVLYEAASRARSEQEKKRIREELENVHHQFNNNAFAAMAIFERKNLAPQQWKPVNDYAMEKAADSVANAMYIFHKNNPGVDMNKMPMLSIENFAPYTPISTGKELKQLVDTSRKKFVKLMVDDAEDKQAAEKIAKKIAGEHIGATWDVGHINLMRKAGYTADEIKEYGVEQLKHVAKDVKHLHITDNFGFHDSHLPPGMGNVPIEDVMKELEAAGFKGRAIVEAGAFVKEFEQSPTHMVYEYFNSPMYQKGPSPYWGNELMPGYRSNFIEFPQEHFNMYGSSFSTLPKVFGGQVGGEKSRFSDTPTA